MKSSRWSASSIEPLVRLHRCAGWPGSILVAKAKSLLVPAREGLKDYYSSISKKKKMFTENVYLRNKEKHNVN